MVHSCGQRLDDARLFAIQPLREFLLRYVAVFAKDAAGEFMVQRARVLGTRPGTPISGRPARCACILS